MNAIILHDAITDNIRPDELDVLDQVRVVADALVELGYEVRASGVHLNLEILSTLLSESQPDLVFNLVESLAGQGRLIHVVPGLLEALGVPFTGSSGSASLLTTNKPLAKSWLHWRGIPTPAWRSRSWPRSSPEPPLSSSSSVATLMGRSMPAPMGLSVPCVCIVKPVWEDASVGIEDGAVLNLSSEREMEVALDAASNRFGDVFAEQYIEGREFNVSLLADGDDVEILPVAEIDFVDFPPDKPRIVGYSAKWAKGSFEYGATPRRFDFPASDAALLDRLGKLALECWRVFELRGYARVDFRVDAAGKSWVLEVNVNPCLSADAGFMAAAGRRGLTAREVVSRVVVAAMAPMVREVAARHV